MLLQVRKLHVSLCFEQVHGFVGKFKYCCITVQVVLTACFPADTSERHTSHLKFDPRGQICSAKP